MLAVKAVFDYTGSSPDQLNFKTGQIFYVLSITEDGRKYYISTSSRVPFSRNAKAGYAPVAFFDVIGDTLPADQRPKGTSLMRLPQSQQMQEQLKLERQQIRQRMRQQEEEEKKNIVNNVADLTLMRKGRDVDSVSNLSQKRSSAVTSARRMTDIAAAAKNIFDGITGRALSGVLTTTSVDKPLPAPPAATQAAAAAVSTDTTATTTTTITKQVGTQQHQQQQLLTHIAAARIVTFKRRMSTHVVEYRIVYRLSNDEFRTVRRTYPDFHAMHQRVFEDRAPSGRSHTISLPGYPRDLTASDKTQIENLGRSLNTYLQTLLQVQREILAEKSAVQDEETLSLMNDFFNFGSAVVSADDVAAVATGMIKTTAPAVTTTAPATVTVKTTTATTGKVDNNNANVSSSSPISTTACSTACEADDEDETMTGNETYPKSMKRKTLSSSRRPSTDSGFATMNSSRKGSFSSDKTLVGESIKESSKLPVLKEVEPANIGKKRNHADFADDVLAAKLMAHAQHQQLVQAPANTYAAW